MNLRLMTAICFRSQKEEKKTSHEFHEIVMNYCRSRKSLLSVEEDLKLLRQNYEQVQAELWVIHKRNITVEVSQSEGGIFFFKCIYFS